MNAPILISLAGTPIVLQVAAPGFCAGKPEIHFEERIPPDRHALLTECWMTPVPSRLINFHVLRRVYVVGEGLVFDQDLRLIVESVTQNQPHDIASAFEVLQKARTSNTVTARPGVSLLCGKMGMSNYGHWMLEMLPMAYLSREFIAKGWSVFLPVIYPWMDDILYDSLAKIGISRHSCFGNDGKPCFFEELVFVSGLSQVGRYYLPIAVECMQSLAAANSASAPSRLWVSRLDIAGKHRSLACEEELCPALASLGWRILEPGSLRLREQIEVAKGATHIAGVAGAGLTNIGFMPPGGRVTVFMPAPTPDIFFQQIAFHRGLQYREVRCELEPSDVVQTGLSGRLAMSLEEVLAFLT